MKNLELDLGERSYPILISRELVGNSALWLKYIAGRQVCIVTNETIAPLYLDNFKALLGEKEICEVILPDGEAFKTLATLQQIFDTLLENNHNRGTTLIALGGGVVGDMCGFAAACYQRGVQFIQVPTTLLSMVDSSVGGKTGVNHPLGKNMIGAFHQPNCVLADLSMLETLPDREFSAGMAEVIKYGLICDAPFFKWLEDNIAGLMRRDGGLLEEAVYQSCLNKARVVAEDEREGGRRAILNLGHTFGHAIETAEGYGNWLHGEAVSAGMVLALALSVELGWLDESVLLRGKQLLQMAGLPVAPPENMNVDQFLQLMGRDKKVLDGRLRLVLLKGLGVSVVSSDAPENTIAHVLRVAGVRA
ncbi:3-dehydroquinate synthase [Zhongshania aliphaticivorans]|uniref:3-dehydroquinate synthase n=1 Tax=Zhongshania aliphaticivorans TaxID=1470434 RepID=A0A5S9N2I2_9GAMM|nr:3-dehydroquinate synthase [Zhongshania aliphaticivorans]CAA0082693.1 3-dehydroquinate synthase [Zhongshania aliphaticivorans]CAA0084086.1 3-dehydroquinate synthase [Zhongshania aliphaticivorans]